MEDFYNRVLNILNSANEPEIIKTLSVILCKTEIGTEIYRDLIANGFCKVTLEGVMLYLNSLDIKEKHSSTQILVNFKQKTGYVNYQNNIFYGNIYYRDQL